MFKSTTAILSPTSSPLVLARPSSRSLRDDHLVPVLVPRPPRSLALCQPAKHTPRVLVALGFATTTTVRMVARVHGDTSDAGPDSEPSFTTGFADLFLLVFFAASAGAGVSASSRQRWWRNLLADDANGTDALWMQLSHFPTLKLDQRPSLRTQHAERHLTFLSRRAFPDPVGDDLAKRPGGPTELHLALGLERDIVDDRPGRTQVEREDVARFQGQRA